MDNFFKEAVQTMEQLYGKDVVMSLATVKGDKPNARFIDAYFYQNAFYVTSYALSNKMKEISKNPNVALNYGLFIAHGTGENLGHPLKQENKALREELRKTFISFYDRHVDEEDENTCILKVTLSDALVFANDYKYFVDFENQRATREDYVVDIVF